MKSSWIKTQQREHQDAFASARRLRFSRAGVADARARARLRSLFCWPSRTVHFFAVRTDALKCVFSFLSISANEGKKIGVIGLRQKGRWRHCAGVCVRIICCVRICAVELV